MEKSSTSITAHLEGFLQTARNLEDALAEEKKKTQKIAQEYITTRATLENGVRELQSRLYQRETKLRSMSESLNVLRLSEDTLRKEMSVNAEREKKNAEELAQFKLAWNEVLAREAQAREKLLDLERTKRALQDQQNKSLELEISLKDAREALENQARESAAKQKEVQNAYQHLQVAEKKHQHLQAEVAAAMESRKKTEATMLRMEADLRAELEWELTTERAALRADTEKEITADRKHVRDSARNQMRIEIARVTEEKSQELKKLQARFLELTDMRNRENERARSRQLDLTEENHQMTESLREIAAKHAAEMAPFRKELAILHVEAKQFLMRLETQKRDSNKSLLVEHLRHEAQIETLQNRIVQLMRDGVYVEKIDSVPEGFEIHASRVIQAASESASPSFMNN